MFEVMLVLVGFLLGWVALSWVISRLNRLESPPGHKVRIVVEMREPGGEGVSSTQGDVLMCDMTCEQLAAYLDRFGNDYTIAESRGVAVVVRRCVGS